MDPALRPPRGHSSPGGYDGTQSSTTQQLFPGSANLELRMLGSEMKRDGGRMTSSPDMVGSLSLGSWAAALASVLHVDIYPKGLTDFTSNV